MDKIAVLIPCYNEQENVEAISKAVLESLTRDLTTATQGEEDGAQAILDILETYSGELGLNGYSRTLFILDGETGEYLAGNNDDAGKNLSYDSANLTHALATGEDSSSPNMAADYMDVAITLDRGGSSYVIYILDNKTTVNSLISQMFVLILESLVFGLVISILLSFLLSKTMIIPIQRLTEGAMRVAHGDFSRKIQVASRDEIGVLTDTFNDMAGQLQDTLRQVENERNKLDTLFLHMTDGVVAFGPNGMVIQYNPASVQMLGRTLDATVTFQELFSQEASFEELLALQRPQYLEAQKRAGSRELELFMTPFAAEQTPYGALVVIHDVTEQRKNEQMRREFVANVSHELRTPLTNIRSYAETIMDSGDEMPPALRGNFLGVIVSEADRMTRIVQDLLTLSKFDYGKMEMNIARFPFAKAVSGVYEAVVLDAQNHGHQLTLHLPEHLPEVDGDRERIEQVIMNIVSNAIKYTPDGGKIDMTAGVSGQQVFVRIADNGIGIL